jgi:hypothetical protein
MVDDDRTVDGNLGSTLQDETTRLVCQGLNEITLDVTILQPALAAKRGLLHLEADPLPVQFTGAVAILLHLFMIGPDFWWLMEARVSSSSTLACNQHACSPI